MPRNKKKFIDKKRDRTATFSLVHRSQRDPLAADPDAPQHVLLDHSQVPEPKETDKEEERKWGVFYDDDYDYMQHLKERDVGYDFSAIDSFVAAAAGQDSEDDKDADQKKGVKFNLPSEVFATRGREEDVGLLNKAAPMSGPRLDWDPDIVETLDDAFAHQEVLTLKDLEKEVEAGEGDDDLDDIFAAAMDENAEVLEVWSEEEEEEQDFDSDFGYSDDEEDDEVPELHGRLFMEEETRSRFTNYSMSSSVIRRNEGLALLDDKFEEFFAEYDDMNVGGLETDDIEGSRNVDVDVNEEKHPGDLVMGQILNEFEKAKQEERQPLPNVDDNYKYLPDGDGPDRPPVVDLEVEAPKDRFDCQSIISTYSNIYNHPKLIKDPIRISGKTGMPKDVLGKGLTAGALKKLDRETGVMPDHDDDVVSKMSELSFRNRHETPEEKKARKAMVKELKRERRVEKKANKTAFKQELNRQEKQQKSQNHQKNSVKIL